MTCRLLSLSSEAMWPELLRLLENRDNPNQTVETDVRAMLDAVRKGGDSAVLEYVRRFDCPDMRPPLRVPAEDLEQAARDIPAESLDCIKQAADNIRAFHEAQKESLMVPHPRRRHDPRPEDRSCGPRGPLCPRRAWRQHAAHLEPAHDRHPGAGRGRPRNRRSHAAPRRRHPQSAYPRRRVPARRA